MSRVLFSWIKNTFLNIDWVLILTLIPILFFGLITMFSFDEQNSFFYRQLIWIIVSFIIFFIFSGIDFKFLKQTKVVIWLYFLTLALLSTLFFIGSVFKGAQSWIDFGFFAFQPVEVSKIVLIIVLAKYFSRRHIEIRNIRHILVSGAYAAIVFLLVAMQPDFGSSLIIGLIWLGMVSVSGISKKHLLAVFSLGAIAFIVLWFFVFQDYQKARLVNFLNPMQDIQGTGYNAYQSKVAVGSGQFFGKGVGYGTQSRLRFLPEYQTDFIFAAYAEEWGFLGVLILFFLYIVLILRILKNSRVGTTNFEILYGAGLVILFTSHFIIHIGMNIGILPVTGLTLTFMSYGGSHMLMAFMGLGILMSMRRNARAMHRGMIHNEMIGVGGRG
jgi:rod shape determining protein RodA